MSTTSPINDSNMQAIPSVTLIAAAIPSFVVLTLIAAVTVPVITMCLCRKRGNELQQQARDVYYCNAEVDLPPLPPRNTNLKRNTDPQYWTITDAKESQTKLSILHNAKLNDKDCQPRATRHEVNYNDTVQEQDLTLNQSCITVTSRYNANTVSHPDVEGYIANISGNIAYSSNNEAMSVTDNAAYNTDIAIAPDVSTQENFAYDIRPLQSVCDD